MKTTMDIPDDLYRRVKARSAIEGRAVREVTIELYRRWLSEASVQDARSATERLRDWLDSADRALEAAPPGPTARDILTDDRNRLERR
jgi:alkanesulfonate monooxygenase SsuD/methylene tetrahydromethanopterin reductase-like flavin-dependent oxidoreductase (luciferase family)